jgi:metallo-beta-lactamase class B
MSHFTFLVLAALAAPAVAQAPHEGNRPFPPYKIVGNVYYVGADDITAYLVATPAGHILLNSGYVETVPLVRDSIRKLGFRVEDVKILLNSQAHGDHVAGQAAMQKLTGAKVYSSERDAVVIESGGRADPRWGREQTYPPVKVDHVVSDGEQVKLGDSVLVAHLTPGHSIGCTTWTMRVLEGGKPYDVVFVGGVTINPGVHFVGRPTYPGIADDYARTFRVLRALQCDVFLGAHGNYYGMIRKYRQMQQSPQPNPFLDPQGYRELIDRSERAYLDQLKRETAAATPKP